MKTKILQVALLLLIPFNVFASKNNQQEVFGRINKNINREWKFTLGNPVNGPEKENYNDLSWERIGLPHTFSLPYFRSEKFYVGYGWYRKNLKMSPLRQR